MSGPVHALLIEADPDDARRAIRVLGQARIRPRVHVATDGAQALAFLRRRGTYADAPRPDLILLDLDIPRIGGRALLGAIQSDDALRRIPVIVMRGTDGNDDVDGLPAKAYVTKPLQHDALLDVVNAIDRGGRERVRPS